MIRHFLILFIFCLGSMVVEGQGKENWKTLSKVVQVQKMVEEVGFEMDVPVFSEQIKQLEGKTIELRGYILALEGIKAQSHFMFSLFPYDICFFCGGAGPETVVEAFVKNDKKLNYSSKPVTIKGVLELNDSDINRHMYILREVVLVN